MNINIFSRIATLLAFIPVVLLAQPTERLDTIVSGSYRLPATITYPDSLPPSLGGGQGKALLPAILLVHGSGPSDRDETVGANKPFRDLARGLAAEGFVVLRYDKRTFVYRQQSAPDGRDITIDDEVTDDAVAAVRHLQALPGINPRRIYVVGHSLGAMMAPRIAQRATGVAGVVLMAAPARDMLTVVRDQLQTLMPDAPESVREAQLRQLQASAPDAYWRSLDEYNATATASVLPVPMLILQGERDYQVTMTDYLLWMFYLKGRNNVSWHSYPRLNHLFMEGEGPSTPAEYDIPSHIPPYVIKDIAEWCS